MKGAAKEHKECEREFYTEVSESRGVTTGPLEFKFQSWGICNTTWDFAVNSSQAAFYRGIWVLKSPRRPGWLLHRKRRYRIGCTRRRGQTFREIQPSC